MTSTPIMTATEQPKYCYIVTGANSGIGLEATKQLASYLHLRNEKSVTIYMLCRSEERTRAAMATIGTPDILQFLKFDGSDSAETIQNHCVDKLPDGIKVEGILLNAGGFGDNKKQQKDKKQQSSSTTSNNSLSKDDVPVASSIAQANLIGHAILIDRLLKADKIDSSTRIVASGSEAAFASGVPMDFDKADFDGILQGTASLGGIPGVEYGWTKALLALYWAAFARHHPDLFVVTVSPGSVTTTNLLRQGGVNPFLRTVSKMAMFLGGSHQESVAAKRYIDALLGEERASQESGSFWASRKGYTKDYGDVSNLTICKFLKDVTLQEKAWNAVRKFVPL
ncbi:short-chain dehydrogenase [Nitzschia inconspicua]|uniref:Short-chain dehydrogenase n=1 Tax=Nitzschia inconspicua TaxID=303405 RepID=A0A9K3LP06_9STRA|nr:short-chain dehydrogenase [Nitzschia inconspicua]